MMTELVKFASYSVFVASTTLTVFSVRASRTSSEISYSTSLVLFLIDTTKIIVCLVAIYFKHDSFQNISILNIDTAVPAALYTWQTQLLLYAAKFLDASTYQILGQLKILTTALFGRVLLQQKLAVAQYVSLIFLSIGSALVTFDENEKMVRTTALIAMVAAGISSGFASVWTERCLKGRTFWAVNVELSMFSALLSLSQFVVSEVLMSDRINSCGLWCGFNKFVASVIVLQVISGLLIGLILKHADSVRKNFATGVSLVLTCFIETRAMRVKRKSENVVGTAVVVASLLLYAGVDVALVTFTACIVSVTFELLAFV